jgi:uncharacterized protein
MTYPIQLQSIATAQPFPLLFATISGAHLYGFPSPDSDYDLRGVHILPLTEVIGLNTGKETIEVSELQTDFELDLVTHDIKKFFTLMLKRNGYVLEQLFSPLIVQTTGEHEELMAIASHKDSASQCITRHHSHHYLGFAKTQWHLLAKEPQPRVKPLLYLYRVLLTGIHLMQTGEVEANLVTLNQEFQLSYLPDLIVQKQTGTETEALGKIDLDFHEREYQRLCQCLEEASQRSPLPTDSSAKEALHDLLVRVRLKTTTS